MYAFYTHAFTHACMHTRGQSSSECKSSFHMYMCKCMQMYVCMYMQICTDKKCLCTHMHTQVCCPDSSLELCLFILTLAQHHFKCICACKYMYMYIYLAQALLEHVFHSHAPAPSFQLYIYMQIYVHTIYIPCTGSS
jgi:hypothetical protein